MHTCGHANMEQTVHEHGTDTRTKPPRTYDTGHERCISTWVLYRATKLSTRDGRGGRLRSIVSLYSLTVLGSSPARLAAPISFLLCRLTARPLHLILLYARKNSSGGGERLQVHSHALCQLFHVVTALEDADYRQVAAADGRDLRREPGVVVIRDTRAREPAVVHRACMKEARGQP